MDDIQKDVSGNPSPAVKEDVKTEVVAPVVEAQPEPKGSKTPESNLYAALEEERRLRKEAEQRAKELEQTQPSDEVYSDEGKILKKEIGGLKAELESLREEREVEKVKSQFPALKDKSTEFDEFRKDYPRHKLENVAKLFMAEQGLLEDIQPRKGLEKPTAGPKNAIPSGFSVEDVANLRRTNFKKYTELLMSGKLNPDDIK